MEAKKNPKADLTEKRPAILLLGLTLSLSITLAAFEWKKFEAGELMDLGSLDDDFDEMVDVPITEIPPAKPPVIKQPKIIEIEDDEEIIDEIDFELDIEITEDDVIEDIVFDEPDEEVVEDTFILAPEIQASFEGGQKAWLKFLRKNLKYPKQAQRMGREGKVFLRFIVDKEGNVSDISVTRGIGAGCDEEAIRVLSMSPKWNPGKQRGRPVKSPMAIAIVFRLN